MSRWPRDRVSESWNPKKKFEDTATLNEANNSFKTYRRIPAELRLSSNLSFALSGDEKKSLGRCGRKGNGREARDPDQTVFLPNLISVFDFSFAVNFYNFSRSSCGWNELGLYAVILAGSTGP